MPLFYIIEETSMGKFRQEVHLEPNRHLYRAYNLLITNLVNNLVIISNHEQSNTFSKNDFRNYLLSHYNGNIYLNSLTYYLEEYKNQHGIELDINPELAKQFDQFYSRLTIDVNDCDRFHQYQPIKFQNLVFGKIIV